MGNEEKMKNDEKRKIDDGDCATRPLCLDTTTNPCETMTRKVNEKCKS